MVLLAVVSLLLLAAEDSGYVPPQHRSTLVWVDLVIVGVFLFEYVARLRRQKEKGAFIVRNWYELPGMIPIIPGLEAYAAVRWFRLLRIFRILRLFGALRRFERFNQALQRFTRQSKIGYVTLMAAALILVCAGLAWILEPQTFTTYGDALWWAVVTATTVGYGDLYPRSGLVRSVAVILMLLGVALIGTFAALLGNFLIQRRFSDQEQKQHELVASLERLSDLHLKGRLTDEEYGEAKRRLLGSE